MKRRLLLSVTAGLLLMAGLPPPAGAQRSVQEGLARATPAVVLVVAEVASEVTLDCGAGPIKVTPPVFRETGTGWFIDADGWLMTNGHVVQPAYRPPPWLVNQQAQRAVTTACLPSLLKRKGLQPGEWSEAEEVAKRKLLDRLLPTASVRFQPQVFVVTAKGQLQGEVKKYSAPASREGGEMSGRDLALLKVSGDNFPVLFLADSRSAQIGDPVHIIGFPGVVLSNELLSQSAMVAASVTNGAISGFNQDRNKNPLIQTDTPATWGNSGAPMVNGRGQVVGVLTFVSLAPGPEGGIIQGFNFVIPSQAVTDFVRGTPVRFNAGGRFDNAWYAGLNAWFSHHGAVDVQLEAGRPAGQLLRREAHGAGNPERQGLVGVGRACIHEDGSLPFLDHLHDRGGLHPVAVPPPAAEELASGAAGLELDINGPVVAYCTSPDEATSARMTQELRRRGFKNVKILKGGLGGWIIAGLPVDTPSDLSQIGKELYKALASGKV